MASAHCTTSFFREGLWKGTDELDGRCQQRPASSASRKCASGTPNSRPASFPQAEQSRGKGSAGVSCRSPRSPCPRPSETERGRPPHSFTAGRRVRPRHRTLPVKLQTLVQKVREEGLPKAVLPSSPFNPKQGILQPEEGAVGEVDTVLKVEGGSRDRFHHEWPLLDMDPQSSLSWNGGGLEYEAESLSLCLSQQPQLCSLSFRGGDHRGLEACRLPPPAGDNTPLDGCSSSSSCTSISHVIPCRSASSSSASASASASACGSQAIAEFRRVHSMSTQTSADAVIQGGEQKAAQSGQTPRVGETKEEQEGSPASASLPCTSSSPKNPDPNLFSVSLKTGRGQHGVAGEMEEQEGNSKKEEEEKESTQETCAPSPHLASTHSASVKEHSGRLGGGEGMETVVSLLAQEAPEILEGGVRGTAKGGIGQGRDRPLLDIENLSVSVPLSERRTGRESFTPPDRRLPTSSSSSSSAGGTTNPSSSSSSSSACPPPQSSRLVSPSPSAEPPPTSRGMSRVATPTGSRRRGGSPHPRALKGPGRRARKAGATEHRPLRPQPPSFSSKPPPSLSSSSSSSSGLWSNAREGKEGIPTREVQRETQRQLSVSEVAGVSRNLSSFCCSSSSSSAPSHCVCAYAMRAETEGGAASVPVPFERGAVSRPNLGESAARPSLHSPSPPVNMCPVPPPRSCVRHPWVEPTVQHPLDLGGTAYCFWQPAEVTEREQAAERGRRVRGENENRRDAFGTPIEPLTERRDRRETARRGENIDEWGGNEYCQERCDAIQFERLFSHRVTFRDEVTGDESCLCDVRFVESWRGLYRDMNVLGAQPGEKACVTM